MSAKIIPTLRYHDAPAAIEWLGRAFGFTAKLVVPGEAGTIAHAQLVLDGGMVMIGSAADDEFGRLQSPPVESGAVVNQSPYIVVPDIDAHYLMAEEAGADIVMPLMEQSYGGKGYSCRDPEGNLWNFGDYDPWAAGADSDEEAAG